MKKVGIILIIVSIIVLISACVAFGFFEQIKNLGFNLAPLGSCLIILSITGIFIGTSMIYVDI